MELFQVEGFDSESFCGYKQITTFYTDFSIAEHFGEGAINDTFNRAFNDAYACSHLKGKELAYFYETTD